MIQPFIRLHKAPPDGKSWWHSVGDAVPTLDDAFDAFNIWLAWRKYGMRFHGSWSFGGGFFDKDGFVHVKMVDIGNDPVKAFLEAEYPIVWEDLVNVEQGVYPQGPLK